MQPFLFFLSGININKKRGLEIGETPSFSMLELSSLVDAFFNGFEAIMTSTCWRLVETELPLASKPFIKFLRRAISIDYGGTEDYHVTCKALDLEQAVESFSKVLDQDPELHPLLEKLVGDARSFSVFHVFHPLRLASHVELAVKQLVASHVDAATHLKVDLRNPDCRIAAIITQSANDAEEFHFFLSFNGVFLEHKGFITREAKYRPAFDIGTMNPPLTTLMVNIAAPRAGMHLVDPMCGTGGILIEALVQGIPCIGVELANFPLKGCIKNLRFFNKNRTAGFHLIKASVFELPFRDVLAAHDAGYVMATDPPYGRISSAFHLPIEQYAHAIGKVAGMYTRLCIAIPFDDREAVEAQLRDDIPNVEIFVEEKVEHVAFSRAVFLAKIKQV
jgi:tRNA G10  N-methylase Trm11